MKKITTFILVLLTLSSCGLARYNANMFHMLKSDLTPHGHKVKKSGKNSFPENGTGIVSLDLKSPSGSGVNSLWRKVNEDGTFSKRTDLTYANPFKKGRTESMLEPGTYFLDGLGVTLPSYGGYVRIGAFSDLFSKEQFGWDLSKNQPVWFSFTIKKGQEVYIPDIEIAVKCKNNLRTCEVDDVLLLMKIDRSNKSQELQYKIGRNVQIN